MSELTLKIYEATETKAPVTLRLVKDGTMINLVVVDVDGDTENTLMTFYDDGTVARDGDVNPDYGFNLNDGGQLLFDDEV